MLAPIFVFLHTFSSFGRLQQHQQQSNIWRMNIRNLFIYFHFVQSTQSVYETSMCLSRLYTTRIEYVFTNSLAIGAKATRGENVWVFFAITRQFNWTQSRFVERCTWSCHLLNAFEFPKGEKKQHFSCANVWCDGPCVLLLCFSLPLSPYCCSGSRYNSLCR